MAPSTVCAPTLAVCLAAAHLSLAAAHLSPGVGEAALGLRRSNPVMCSQSRSGRNVGGRAVGFISRAPALQTGPLALAMAAVVASGGIGYNLGERSAMPPMPCETSDICIRQRQAADLTELQALRQSIFGHIFQQKGTVGLASYHFVSPESSYISYAAAPPAWKLADGSAPPARKYFVSPSYDATSRTFHGTIFWGHNPISGNSAYCKP